MEAFTLLKYWRSSGGTGGGTAALFTSDSNFTRRAAPKTISTPHSDHGEEGPYFDLEFSLTDDDAEEEAAPKSPENTQCQNDEEHEEAELKFDLTSDENIADHNLTLSPSDGLLFKGHLVPCSDGSGENPKSPVSILKSATRFGVLFLKLKKSKSAKGFSEKSESDVRENDGKVSDKLFAVKFKIEEVKGPLVSLFARDNSSSNSATDERKLSKELVLQKYLKMLKPLYIRVSSRYVEKLKFSWQVSFSGGGAVSAPCTAAAPSNLKTYQKQGSNNLRAGLEVVRKHLGKSRSTSVAVAVQPPGQVASNRRDDSLVELQDGIQGAISHCKRSFNASRDGESAVLSRSVSDPSYVKCVIVPTVSCDSTSLYSGEAREI